MTCEWAGCRVQARHATASPTRTPADRPTDAVLAWLICGVTYGGVATGRYVRDIRYRRRRPSLWLHFDGEDEEDAVIVPSALPFLTWQEQPSTPTAYLRLRVRNRDGRDTAEDVEVLIERVRELEPRVGNAPSPSPALGNWPLPWSSSNPTTTRLTVPSGVARHVDLAHVYRNEAATRGATPLILDIRPEPTMDRHHLDFGKTEIRLVVSARNAAARRYVLVVAFDGRWGQDDVWNHLRVEELREG